MHLVDKLNALGVTLQAPPGPFGVYVPAKRVRNLVYVSGQLPMRDGTLMAVGQVPSRCTIEEAKAAARQCVINALSAVQAVEGHVNHIVGVIRVGAFVSSDTHFTQQPLVANGASEFLVELLGDAGKHVRAAVGVNTLPLDSAVEVEIIFEVR